MSQRVLHCPEDRVFVDGFDAIREELDIRTRFPEAVLAEAAEAARRGPVVPPGSNTAVRDATDIEFVAIDPPGSSDLDQALCIHRHGTGSRIFYAIADVASLVAPGEPIDIEARLRGVTLYSPDSRESLHPVSINEGAGSLLEGAERQAVLWTIDLDADGQPVSTEVQRARVINRAQLSYHDAQRIIDNQSDSMLGLLKTVGEQRAALEAERGAVSLQIPAQEVVALPQGGYGLEFDETLPVENWNAQVSLLTGMEASKLMIEAGVGLLRTLPPPDPQVVHKLRLTARALGIEWPDDVDYAEQIRSLVPDTPQRAALLTQAARGLRGAGYVAFTNHDMPELMEHSAIASTYSHVTAPLRRLCDRFANEILLAICANQAPPAWAVEGIVEMPSAMGRARQRDRALERTMVDYVEAVVLQSSIGQTFSGVVTDVDDDGRGGRVQIVDPAIVAKIDGHQLELGSAVKVVLTNADPKSRRVEFETR